MNMATPPNVDQASRPPYSLDRQQGCDHSTHMNDDSAQPSNVHRRGKTLSSIRSIIGLHEKPPINDEHENLEHQELLWSSIRLALREPFAEFFGTFVMVRRLTIRHDNESKHISSLLIAMNHHKWTLAPEAGDSICQSQGEHLGQDSAFFFHMHLLAMSSSPAPAYAFWRDLLHSA